MKEDTKEHRELFDLIEKLLDYEPKSRMMLEEAVEHTFFDALPSQQHKPLMHPGRERDRGRSTRATTNGARGDGVSSNSRITRDREQEGYVR
jgi:serine/threonine protein kinase